MKETKKNKTLVPKLRFKEFTGNWEKKTFKELVTISQGLQINISERLTEHEKGSLFYITNEFLRENSAKKYFIKDAPKSVICDENDILMTRTGNTGKVVTDVKGAFHNNFFKIDFPKSINKFFLVNFLKLTKTQNLILKLAGTSTIPDLNHSDFYKISFFYPKLEEQQKIASFLSLVDTKLSILQQKKDRLADYKKGIMQQVFPSANSEVPQLRFKDKDGNEFPKWEEKRLGEIGEIITGKTPKTSDKNLWGGKIQFITPTDINEYKKYQHYTQRTVVESDKLKILPKGTIVYTCIASIGKMAITTKYSITNQQINSIIPNKIYNNEFIYYALLKITPKIKSTQANNTLPIINKTEFSKVKIQLPCLEEQTKIANLLSTIDKKITLVSCQIKNTKQLKKGLLQQMFV